MQAGFVSHNACLAAKNIGKGSAQQSVFYGITAAHFFYVAAQPAGRNKFRQGKLLNAGGSLVIQMLDAVINRQQILGQHQIAYAQAWQQNARERAAVNYILPAAHAL